MCDRKFLSHKSPSGRMRSYARGTKAALFHVIETRECAKRTFVLMDWLCDETSAIGNLKKKIACDSYMFVLACRIKNFYSRQDEEIYETNYSDTVL